MLEIFTFIGSLAGFGALYLHYKEYKKNKPIINCILHHSHYEFTKNDEMDILQINASFLINNSGKSPTSLINCFTIIQLHPHSTLLNNVDGFYTKANQNLLPIDIKASGTTQVELSFSLEIGNFKNISLDRCLIPINTKNPNEKDYDDLPLAVRFEFKHTFGTFNDKGCIFRKDQKESKYISGEVGPLLFSNALISKDQSKFELI